MAELILSMARRETRALACRGSLLRQCPSVKGAQSREGRRPGRTPIEPTSGSPTPARAEGRRPGAPPASIRAGADSALAGGSADRPACTVRSIVDRSCGGCGAGLVARGPGRGGERRRSSPPSSPPGAAHLGVRARMAGEASPAARWHGVELSGAPHALRGVADPDPGRLLREGREHADDGAARHLAVDRDRRSIPLRASLLHLPVALVEAALAHRLAEGPVGQGRRGLDRPGAGVPAARAPAVAPARAARAGAQGRADLPPLLRAGLERALVPRHRASPLGVRRRADAAVLRREARQHLARGHDASFLL